MPAGLHLQKRDLDLLAQIGELGLLDTETIRERFFPGVTLRRVQQRLQLYRDHGLIRTIVLTVWFGESGTGRIPAIHCLAERGGDAVHSLTGHRPRRVLRGDPKPETFHHRLAIVKSRLAIDDACTAAGLLEPTWIMEQDYNSAATDEPPLKRRILYHAFRVGPKTITCQPDAASLLFIPRDPAQPQIDTTNLLAYLEIDRSSESRAQILAKLLGYASVMEQNGYRRYWPQLQKPAIRVFWVCRSKERIDAICEKLEKESIAKFFRFTTAGELSGKTALTMPIWRDLAGNRRAVLQFSAALPATN
jgi:hypothetical protein